MQADKLRELPARWRERAVLLSGLARPSIAELARAECYRSCAAQLESQLLALAEGAEADRADAIGELQSVEHSMKAGGQTLVTYRVLDTNYHAPMHVRIVSLDAALAGAVTQGEG